MLRNRSRAATTKQPLMADHASPSSPSPNLSTPISSYFGSPMFFNGFLAKVPSDTQTLSPTSIIDNKVYLASAVPFGYHRNHSEFSRTFSETKHSWEKPDPKGIGLALVDSIGDETSDYDLSEPNRRMVLFGSKLKIQIPPLPPSAISPAQSPSSPADFGIKTRSSQFLGSLSPFGSVGSGTETGVFPHPSTGCLSTSEMELSEDYTCVISRGPNPKTTHIYGNCIVECCCGAVRSSALKNDSCSLSSDPNSPRFCCSCRKNTGQGKDIYMHSGEEGFGIG